MYEGLVNSPLIASISQSPNMVSFELVRSFNARTVASLPLAVGLVAVLVFGCNKRHRGNDTQALR
jgi:hypothetical protein